MKAGMLIQAGTGNEPDMDTSANRIVLLVHVGPGDDMGTGYQATIYVDPFGPPLPIFGDLIEWEEDGGKYAWWSRAGDTFRIRLRKRGYEIDGNDRTRNGYQ